MMRTDKEIRKRLKERRKWIKLDSKKREYNFISLWNEQVETLEWVLED